MKSRVYVNKYCSYYQKTTIPDSGQARETFGGVNLCFSTYIILTQNKLKYHLFLVLTISTEIYHISSFSIPIVATQIYKIHTYYKYIKYTLIVPHKLQNKHLLLPQLTVSKYIYNIIFSVVQPLFTSLYIQYYHFVLPLSTSL